MTTTETRSTAGSPDLQAAIKALKEIADEAACNGNSMKPGEWLPTQIAVVLTALQAPQSVSVPEGWKPSNDDYDAWCTRHDMRWNHDRSAFSDAASLYQTAAPLPQPQADAADCRKYCQREADEAARLARTAAPSEPDQREADMLREVIRIVREYPDFDDETLPFSKMMDQALAGKTPELLVSIECLAQGRMPPAPAPLEAQPIPTDYDHNEGDGLAGRVQAVQPIPKWIDDMKGSDPTMDGVIEHVELLTDALKTIVDRFGPCESDYIFSKRYALKKARAALTAKGGAA